MTNQLRITALTATLALIQLFAICPPAIAQPYDAPPRQLSVMTWNVEWMYDDFKGDNRSKLAKEQSAPSREYWNEKLQGVAAAIAESEAHIVALHEIEGRQTLSAIRNLLKDKHGVSYRYAFIEGTDTFTEQDVGLLFRNGLISYRRQEQSKVMYDSRDYYNLSKHLIGEFRWDGVARPLTVLNVHLRATADAEDKRVKQAKLARKFLEEQIRAGEDVIILGDFNPEHMAITDSDQDRVSVVGGGSIYPAVQNALLACRAEGLGCVLTTLLCEFEPEVREILEIPEPWGTAAAIPIGYSVGKGHGPIKRKPIEKLAFRDTWGTALR